MKAWAEKYNLTFGLSGEGDDLEVHLIMPENFENLDVTFDENSEIESYYLTKEELAAIGVDYEGSANVIVVDGEIEEITFGEGAAAAVCLPASAACAAVGKAAVDVIIAAIGLVTLLNNEHDKDENLPVPSDGGGSQNGGGNNQDPNKNWSDFAKEVATYTAKELNYSLEQGGYGEPAWNDGDEVDLVKLSQDKQFVRFYNPSEGIRPDGGFVVEISEVTDSNGNFYSPAKLKEILALPHEPTDYTYANIPKDTELFTGTAGKNSFGSGGAQQWQIKTTFENDEVFKGLFDGGGSLND